MREGHIQGMFLSGVSKSVMQTNLERSSDIRFGVSRRRRARSVLRGMIDTHARPAAARRRGEAPRVASRGEHGHSLVITQPMIRFCPDRDERRARLFFLFFRVSRRRRDGSARASDRLRLTFFSLEQIPNDRRERDAPARSRGTRPRRKRCVRVLAAAPRHAPPPSASVPAGG